MQDKAEKRSAELIAAVIEVAMQTGVSPMHITIKPLIYFIYSNKTEMAIYYYGGQDKFVVSEYSIDSEETNSYPESGEFIDKEQFDDAYEAVQFIIEELS